MPTRNINLTDHLDRFIDTEISSGRYGNASEVVREGLRLMEQRRREEWAKLKWLRAAVRQGLDEIERGEGIAYHSMEDLAADIDRIAEEVSSEIAPSRQHA